LVYLSRFAEPRWQEPTDHELNADAITPFCIEIPQNELDDLRERPDRTRFTEELPDARWDYGVPVG
jgi:hypothetical protein